MQFYSKIAAAIVGLAVILLGRYGIDLTENQQLLTDAVGSIVTAFGVYFLKNKPTTDAQVEQVREATNEAAKEIREA